MLFGGLDRNVLGIDIKFQIKLARQPRHEFLIAVRLHPAQPVIEMNNRQDDPQLPPQLQQHPQERDRINPSRNRHTHAVPGRKQFVPPDMGKHALRECKHGNMVPQDVSWNGRSKLAAMKYFAVATVLFFLMALGLSQQKDADRKSDAGQAGVSVLMYRDGAGFYIDVPKGWIVDQEVGKRHGTCCVYYPKGATWNSAETVMYPNIATKGPGQRTLDEFMESDLKTFRTHDPEMKYEDAQDVPLERKRVAKVRVFRGVNRGSSEAVAYVDEEKIIALFVMNSKTAQGLNGSMPLFLSAVKSYLYMDVTVDKGAKPAVEQPTQTPKNQ